MAYGTMAQRVTSLHVIFLMTHTPNEIGTQGKHVMSLARIGIVEFGVDSIVESGYPIGV